MNMHLLPSPLARWTGLTLLASLLAGPALALQCNIGGFTDAGDGVPNLPPLSMPFAAGQSWTAGGDYGSYFGNGWHCSQNGIPSEIEGDYYATDWNRNDGGTTDNSQVFPVAAGVVRVSNCNADGYGCRLVIEHSLGKDEHRFRSLYAHLKEQSSFVPGDVVLPWTEIGRVGETGGADGPHLHLGLHSYHQVATGDWRFTSWCNTPLAGSNKCASGEAPKPPQSRKIRYLWEPTGAVSTGKSVVTDGHSSTSANQPRIFLPGIFNGGSWDTNVYVRNNFAGTNTVLVKVFDAAGTEIWSGSNTLANHGSWKVDLGATGIQAGTAIVVAETGKDIVAVARVQRNNVGRGAAFASFEGVEQPLSYQQVPMVHHNNSGFYNQVFLFNPDSEQAVNVSISLSSSTGCNRNFSLGPRQTYNFDTYADTCLPSPWYGQASIEAKYTNNDPAVLAVTSFQERREGENRISLAAAAISTPIATPSQPAGMRLFLPLVQNNNYGFLGGLAAGKNAGSGSLTFTYRTGTGSNCVNDPPKSSWPVITNPIPATANTCPTVLSAELGVTGSVNYVYAQINQLKGEDFSTYPAVAAPTWQVFVPYLDEGSTVLRGIQIQNVATAAKAVTVRFYDHAGNSVGTTVVQVGGLGFATLVGTAIPAAARNAHISAEGNLAVVVNNLWPDSNADVLMDYTAPGRY